MNASHQNGTTTGASAPPRGGTGTREKVIFRANETVFVTLERNPPERAIPGNWGDQYMYSLEGNQIMFVEPEVHEAITRRFGPPACAGDQFAITKRKVGNKAATWEVERIEDEPEPPPPPPPAPVIALPPLVSKPKPREKATPTNLSGSDHISGNLMGAALKQAMDACAEAGFNATSEDVRCMAITIYITATGGRK